MNSKTFVPLLLIVLAVIVWVFWPQFSSLFNLQSVNDGGEVFCTADAMQCPDGSWVGRTGPKCEFVCPGN